MANMKMKTIVTDCNTWEISSVCNKYHQYKTNKSEDFRAFTLRCVRFVW